MVALIVFIVWLAMAFVAGCIGRLRGRWGLGVTLGIFLGVVGVFIIAILPKNHDNLARQEVEAITRDARERHLREAARQRQRYQ
jgi:hypothetical protein